MRLVVECVQEVDVKVNWFTRSKPLAPTGTGNDNFFSHLNKKQQSCRNNFDVQDWKGVVNTYDFAARHRATPSVRPTRHQNSDVAVTDKRTRGRRLQRDDVILGFSQQVRSQCDATHDVARARN